MNSCWKYAQRYFYVLLASIMLLSTAVQVRAADNNATLDIRLKKGYARLVFTFDQAPEYSSKTVSTVFVMKFKSPVKVDLAPVAPKLQGIITIARRDPDGYGLRFAMSRDFKVNVMKAGKHLIVDFLSKRWKGSPPGVPQDIVLELAKAVEQARLAAEERERQEAMQIDPLRVDVHDARQPTFNRISFKWNRFVTAQLTRKGDMVYVMFGGRAVPDLSYLKNNPPNNLAGITHRLGPDSLRIIMKVAKGTKVRAFREGVNYIVDLASTKPRKLSSVEKKLYAATKDNGRGKTKKSEEITLLPIDVKKAPLPKITLTQVTSNKLPDQNANSGPPVPVRSNKAKPQVIETVKPSLDIPKAKPVAKVVEEVIPVPPVVKKTEIPSPQQANLSGTVLIKGDVKSPEKMPVAVSKQQPVPINAATRGTFNPSKGKPPANTNKVVPDTQKLDNEIEVVRNENSVQLRFPFKKNSVAAAIFQRNENLWILLDNTKKLDIKALKKQLGGIVNDIRHERLDKSQLLEFRLSGPWLSSVSQQNPYWNISIGDLVTGSSKKYELVKQINKSGTPEFIIPTGRNGRIHQIKDFNSGDDLLVITSLGPAKSVKKTHEHVEFQLFKTIHGIVIHPLSDELQVSKNPKGVRIVGNHGLYLSGNLQRTVMEKESPRNKRRNEARNLKFVSPQVKDIAKFVRHTLELEKIITTKHGRERRHALMELARHWLSRGFAPEALGMLEVAATENAGLSQDPVYGLMHGIANILLKRYKLAGKDLGTNDLKDNHHASLWRGYLAYKQKNYNRASTEFKRGENAIKAYMPRRQSMFRLAAADTAVASGDPVLADSQLDEMPKSGSTPLQLAMAKFLEGRLMELLNRPHDALQLYADATKANIRPVTAKAVYHLTDLRLRIGDIKSAVGVGILERLSIVWRGDDVELQVLHRLADLYLEKNRYNDAFTLMKTAVQAYPSSERALALQDRMKAHFSDLFLQSKADSMPPIKALALFYDHKYLTPPGRLGDEMIRRLADRLIGVDLLDKAANLLEHQVTRRLKGAGRAQVAIRLAMIHLLQHRPKLALKTIYRTRQPALPAHVHQARKLLEARAYAEMGRSGSALELLFDDDSEEASEIKSLALWNGQKWTKAGEEYEKLLGQKWQQKEKLSSKARVQVLRAAISYSLGSDPLGLNRLRGKYAAKMAGGSDAEAFAMITDPLKSSASAVDRLARDIADIDTLEAFVKAFRQRLERTNAPQTTSTVE